MQIGEKVYDLNTQYIYHIIGINKNAIHLTMTQSDIEENLKMFDCEITEEEYDYIADNPADIYQFVPNLVARDGNPICYEHNKLGEYEEEGGDYPYYSPYLDENLFTFETFSPEEWEKYGSLA